MKISGFTLIRNGIQFDFPFLESLRSLLPLVDELVVNVGIGDDQTLTEIQGFAEKEGQGKMQIFESRWPLDDPEKKKEGRILSEQTNLALARCTGDWCIYLQADEILHEEDYPKIKKAMADAPPSIDGLLFDYLHFYGSFDVVRSGRGAYRREVRAIRRGSGARSVGDAQSFLLAGEEKLAVARSGAKIYHYGWVRPPEKMKEKTFFFDQLYHGTPNEADAREGKPHTGDNYRYKRILGLGKFQGTHPAVMKNRIARQNWRWDLEHSPLEWGWKDLKKVVLDAFENLTGIRLFEYRSYRLK